MKITLQKSREEELSLLTKMEADAFSVQAKYFENGILPPFSEEQKEKNALSILCYSLVASCFFSVKISTLSKLLLPQLVV